AFYSFASLCIRRTGPIELNFDSAIETAARANRKAEGKHV
ncbi:hypothetical protein L195_g062201, partial [Trifolium pratense]